MNIIGINGRKRSGKDTSCQLLSEHINGNLSNHPIAVRAAFADKLKIMAAKALGLTGTDQQLIEFMDSYKVSGGLEAYTYESDLPPGAPHFEKEITGREYLQLFGGKAREVFGDTFWVDRVLPNPDRHGDYVYELEQMYGEGVKYVIVTDVRYPNEAERVHALGGEVWEILRPDLPDDGDDHATEQPLPRDLVDVSIINDGTLNDLRLLLIRALEGDA